MTLMEGEILFPRGNGRSRPHDDRPQQQQQQHDDRDKATTKDSKTTQRQKKHHSSSSSKKRKSSSDEGMDELQQSSSIKTDVLFGNARTPTSTSDKKRDLSKNKKRKTSSDGGPDTALNNSKHSLLPLGGGGVVVVQTRHNHNKMKDRAGNAPAPSSVPKTSVVIEAFGFSKLAKGTKVLACVRDVHPQYILVSLPNLLTAYILPTESSVGGATSFPRMVSVGQTLAVVVQKVVMEPLPGGTSRRRIQVTPLPQAINPRGLLLGDDGSGSGTSLSYIANRLSRSCIPLRGQITSVEDHGCIVDLGYGKKGFVTFAHVGDGKDYTILDDDEDDKENENDDGDENEETPTGKDKKKTKPIVLQKGRLYDFNVLPVASSGDDKVETLILPLSLPTTETLAKQTVSNPINASSTTTPNNNSKHKSKMITATTPLSLSSLTPGWLVQAKVETVATNGLCVSILGNVFRGAIEWNHLGAAVIPTTKDNNSGWKDLFQPHQQFAARIVAVDVATRLVRLSISPRVLNMTRMADTTSPLYGFPAVGTIIPDCTVIKVDPGIGALLTLPSEYDDDPKLHRLPKSLMKSYDLFQNPTFLEACHTRKVYVHISKALDDVPDADRGSAKDAQKASSSLFNKEFAPSTKHTVRILNIGHWMEGVAAGGCARSILDAHVLTHNDIVAGMVYKQVPICAQMAGGSVLVQLGGENTTKNSKKGKKNRNNSSSQRRTGISGLLPPIHMFDTMSAAGGTSEYRQRVIKAKYAVDAKVDVRVLWVDLVQKKCLVTAKKTMVQATSEQIITSYNEAKVGQIAVGFVSKVDDQGLFVTFCNKVYGRVTARSLVTELGIDNHRENYGIGDVVTCRVVKLKLIQRKARRKSFDDQDDDEMDVDDEEEQSTKKSIKQHWELTLSLKTEQDADGDGGGEIIDVENPQQIRIKAGSILPVKSMKIIELVNGTSKPTGGYIPGHAVVSINSKHTVALDSLGEGKMLPNIEFKLPFSQLADSYDPADVVSVEALDEMAKRVLKVGKKINQKGIVLLDPKKSNVDYSSGIGKMPIVSLRKLLIETMEDQSTTDGDEQENIPILPSPDTPLFVGALLRGSVVNKDPRHGAFVRFLDGLTGLVSKKSGGLGLPLYESVLTQVRAIDDSIFPHRILLEVSQGSETRNGRTSANLSTSVKVGQKLHRATVKKISFYELSLKVEGDKSLIGNERIKLYCTNKEGNIFRIKCKNKSQVEKTYSVKAAITKSHPFYGIKVGQELSDLTVLSVQQQGDHFVIFVTDKVSNEKSESSSNIAPFFVSPSQLEPGTEATAIVSGFADDNKGLYVNISPSVTGFVPSLELSTDLNVLNNVESSVPLGAIIHCSALDNKLWHENRSRCPLGLTPEHRRKKMMNAKNDHSLFLSVLALQSDPPIVQKPVDSSLIIGRVNKSLPSIHAPSLMLDLRGGYVGRCCITELDEPDEWVNMPLGRSIDKPFDVRHRLGTKGRKDLEPTPDETQEPDDSDSEGDDKSEDDGIIDDKQYVECRVLKFFPKKGLAEVSLRSSRINGDLDDDPVPSEGDTIQGFVQQTNKKGCFVRISRATEGRATLKELCDGFLPNPETSFPMGRLVVGKIKETRNATKKQSSGSVKFQVDLDMRESVVVGEEEKRLRFEDISVGDKFKGTVQRVETYGVFVKIENSNISGLVHMSECSDGFIKNLEALYNPGDLVKVLVLKKDDENSKLGFSMKASYFEDDDESDESSVDEDMELDDADEAENDEPREDLRELKDGESDSDVLNSDDENFATKLASKIITENSDTEESDVEKNQVEDEDSTSEEEEEEDDDDDENSSDDGGGDSNKGMAVGQDVFDTNVGFDWGASGAGMTKGAENEDDDDDSTESSDSESSDEDEDREGRPKSRKSKKRQAEKRREEQETARRESALADGTADENPESARDFERLLAGAPNNSELWIRFMAFFLSLADVPAARAVADKALERIEFRQENEKLNVWTALFTLEHKYGNDATFQAAIDRACQQCNPKQVYLRACEILEKDLQQSSYNKSDVVRADSLFATMCKKHRSKKTVWLAHMQYLLRQSRHQEAHELAKRAMSSLATHKHAELMSRFAQMEFEYGSPERGRTLFDGLLVKFPKRLDLFFIYLDKECKFGKVEHARSMLEKKVSERRLSDRQMKSVFKKWYRIEEEHGTDETQEHVKDSARAYVQQPKGK